MFLAGKIRSKSEDVGMMNLQKSYGYIGVRDILLPNSGKKQGCSPITAQELRQIIKTIHGAP